MSKTFSDIDIHILVITFQILLMENMIKNVILSAHNLNKSDMQFITISLVDNFCNK